MTDRPTASHRPEAPPTVLPPVGRKLGSAGSRPPSRRNAVVTLMLAVIAIVAVVAVPVLVDRQSSVAVPVAHRSHVATSGRSPGSSPSPSPSATASDPGDAASMNLVLANQAKALLRGDEKGWLAPVDPRSKSSVAAYKRIFHNMRAMHVAAWTQTITWGYATSRRAPFEIDVSYCLVERDCTDTTTTMEIDAELRHQKFTIEAWHAPMKSRYTSQPYPWELETLSAVVGPRVVVAASAAEAYRLRSVLPMAVAAAAADDRFAHWGKPTEYVLYLADKAEFGLWFDFGKHNDIGFEQNVSVHDLEAVVLLPLAATNSGPGGLRNTIQHEFGHVATLQGMYSYDDDSFIEGLADYCASVGHPSWEGYEVEAARQYIRNGKWSKKIYLTKEIWSRNLITVNAAYGIGYLGLHYLTKTYGQSKMLIFWGDVEHDGSDLNNASEQVFHKSWKSVNASAVRYVESALGL